MKFEATLARETRSGAPVFHITRESASADPYAGTLINGLPVLSPDQAADNLNRYGFDWYDSRYGELGGDDKVLTFGFWTLEELAKSYYASQTNPLDFFAEADPAGFVAFSEAQIALAEEALGLWDELIDIQIIRGASAQESDITFGNNDFGPFEGAHAYLPSANDGLHDLGNFFGYKDVGRVSGDVWVNTQETANYTSLGFQSYARQTLVHELGHALGLSHSGDYDANDGPASYDDDAYFFQDSNQYTTMSYFLARETGAGHIDWNNFSFLLPSTPMVHDILAVQKVYGADMTTRAGNTVYGFNSTADRDVFDFSKNALPVLTIWDGGGIDTLDFSGWDSSSIINLNQGAFSSGGGTGAPSLSVARAYFGDPTLTQGELDAILANNGSPDGMLHDNIAIAYGAVIENAVGGGGDDLLVGNGAANVLDGGSGFDTVSYQDAGSGVAASLASMRGSGGDAAGDRYVNIEALSGSNFGDTLSGGNRDDVINGLGGVDRIAGGNGADVLSGGDGNDDVDGGNGNDSLLGDAGNDTLSGGNGDDSLNGAAGADTLSGGNGNDVLNGGAGDDRMSGGNGSDVFLFAEVGGNDIITDFRKGQDKIDLSALDAVSGNEGSDTFLFVGESAFSGTAGELRSFSQNGKAFLQGDVDGDKVADFMIETNLLITQSEIIFV